MLKQKLMGGSGEEPNFVESVFSTWLYTGNGSTQSIVNNIDLSTKGGLVWQKSRSNGIYSHRLTDTARGAGYALNSNNTNDSTSSSSSDVTGFTSSGFNLGYIIGDTNLSGQAYAAWTFRKQPKFFDVVTWTGDDTNNRQIPISLGSVPGTVITKCTSAAEPWVVFARNDGVSKKILELNNTAAAFNDSGAQLTYASSASITVNNSTLFMTGGNASFNTSGKTYVAYLFAHNAGGFGLTGTDNVISCGSYTGNGSATGPVVTLGYEPQWLMVKNASGTGNWQMIDNMRGMPVGSSDATLQANLSNTESSTDYVSPTATGFQITSTSSEVNTNTSVYVYVAIRRGPMKVPTTGTSVFSPNAVNVAAGTQITSGFPVDMTLATYRLGHETRVEDRLRGISTRTSDLTTEYYLNTASTAAEANSVGFTYGWNNTGFSMNNGYANASDVFWSFRRAPGFFDEVCYTGISSNQTLAHNLGTAPQLIIAKKRSGTGQWPVYAQPLGATNYLLLNTSSALTTGVIWNNTAPTASVFSVGADGDVNLSGATYVAYLFATCPGVSKVGSYTGTGTTQTINCGFTAGARFVLIKRTNSTGDWYVWDSARGIVSGNDPYLLLNITAAEVTSTDYIDTAATGFEISSTAPAAINASGGTYIFLAIA